MKIGAAAKQAGHARLKLSKRNSRFCLILTGMMFTSIAFFSNAHAGCEDTTIAYLRASAERGNAMSQDLLAVSYLKGNCVKIDETEAVKWFRKAAEQGDGLGQSWLGLQYYNGAGGLPKDFSEAAKWYRKAAEQDIPEAEYTLGTLLLSGRGVEKDTAAAFKWMHKAAVHGDVYAEAYLAYMYYSGKGVTKDYSEAVKWYTKAAEQEDLGAQLVLGQIYAVGNEVPQNPKEALRWLNAAAEQQSNQAQYNLCMIYEYGNIPHFTGGGDISAKDPFKAYMWSEIALKNSTFRYANIDSSLSMEHSQLEANLTEQQREEAKKMADKWEMDHQFEKKAYDMLSFLINP